MKHYRYEWLDDSSKEINVVLTVALPLKDMGRISWLAFESLRLQQDIDFDWELIVFEDGDESRKILDSFIGKLPGCKRIIYRAMDPKVDGRGNSNRILLIDKWIGMAQEASKTSIGYVLQAGDVLSPNKRLKIHKTHFENKACLFSMYPRAIFLNLKNNKKIFYDAYKRDDVYLKRGYFGRMHCMKAVRTKDILKVPSVNRNKKIDKYIRTNIIANHNINHGQRKYIFSADEIDPNNWKTGVVTDGMNIISNRNGFYDNPVRTWSPYKKSVLIQLGYNKGFKKYMTSEVNKFLELKHQELN